MYVQYIHLGVQMMYTPKNQVNLGIPTKNENSRPKLYYIFMIIYYISSIKKQLYIAIQVQKRKFVWSLYRYYMEVMITLYTLYRRNLTSKTWSGAKTVNTSQSSGGLCPPHPLHLQLYGLRNQKPINVLLIYFKTFQTYINKNKFKYSFF